MDQLEEVFYITSIEQMRGIADPLRLTIIDRLEREPLTVTQLGEQLGETPAKVHYHVREMERLGFIRLVETREKGGILEKYYRAVAQSIQVPRDILQTSSLDEVHAVLQEWFHYIMNEALKALARNKDNPQHEPLTMTTEALWATHDEFSGIIKQLTDIAKPFADPRGIPDERQWMLSFIGNSLETARERNAPIAPVTPPAAPARPKAPAAPTKPKRIFAAGAIEFSRADLEEAATSGRQLDIQVVGSCRFADDITPDLVERAVRRFQHRGKLFASDSVRAALEQKGAR